MKYYATQIGTDPEGAPTILQQVEVGAPLANYWEMRNVCDTNGNTYYSYGSKVGKITNVGVKTEIDINTALTLTEYEVLGIAISKDNTKLIIMINTGINTSNLKFYYIITNGFTNATIPTKINYSYTGMTYPWCATKFIIDKYENIWFSANDPINSTWSRYDLLFSDSLTGKELNGTLMAPNIIAVDDRGFCWGMTFDQATNQLYKIEYRNNNLVEYSYNIGDYSNVIDIVSWSNGAIRKLYALQNNTTSFTDKCYIYVINISTHTYPTVESLITLSYGGIDFTECYNLHTNTNGDIFFSTYGTSDGYNTYKIAYGTTTITLYMAGLGSKTTGNDPYAFFVSQYGHTGANIN